MNKIVGTCQNLEKPYFRLGADPDPAKVRPEHILKLSLKMLKKKWKNKEVQYRYMEDQFKSIRQDLVVQGIKSKLVVKVYETHARVALESADIDHFNQCQTQLKELYESGLKGHEYEFLAYKIVYHFLNDMKFEIGTILNHLSKKQKKNEYVKHALQLVYFLIFYRMRKAYANDDYYKFFELYKTAPNMTPYLLDIYVDKTRLKFLRIIAKS